MKQGLLSHTDVFLCYVRKLDKEHQAAGHLLSCCIPLRCVTASEWESYFSPTRFHYINIRCYMSIIVFEANLQCTAKLFCQRIHKLKYTNMTTPALSPLPGGTWGMRLTHATYATISLLIIVCFSACASHWVLYIRRQSDRVDNTEEHSPVNM